MLKTIQTQIIINSSLQTVWATLTDFEAYSTWNPFLIKAEKTSSQDLKITTCIEGKKTHFSPKIICLKPPYELRWLGRLLGIPGLFQGEHFFLITALSKDKTQVIHGEHFSGLLVSLVWKSLQPRLQNSFSLMNQALKEACEAEKTLGK